MDKSNEFESEYVLPSPTSSTGSESDRAAFFKFPALSRLFQGKDLSALKAMRAQLIQTNQQLERVIRQGTKEEAERALLISRSYALTLDVLDELERHSTQTAK